MPLLRPLAEIMAKVTRASIVLAALMMLACLVYQVVMRYVFSAASSWSEELALLLFGWTVLAGLALGVHEGYHVRLTMLLDPLPQGAKILAERIIDLITAALGGFIVWAGIRFMDVTAGSVSAAMEYPIELLNIMAPLCGGLMALFGLERALRPGGATAAAEQPVL